MKNLLLLLCLTTWAVCGNAQVNLVLNPSFETYINCPNYLMQINRATGWYSSMGTPDYFNSCANASTGISQPSNWAGYRTPSSGNAYVGIITMWPYTHDSKEAIGTQLISPLQIGVKYYASLKVSLGGKYTTANWCGINKLGILFSTVQFDSTTPSPTCVNCAQIYSNTIVTDTLNWTRLMGSFVADSNYSFANIGRFNYRYLTDSIMFVGTDCYSYYYLDDICISTDSSYTYNYTYTGLEENNKLIDISIHPNPAMNYIDIDFTSLDEPYNITIYDVLGREVFFNQEMYEPSEHVPIDKINSGILFIKIKYKNKMFNYKLIKIKQ